FRSPHEVDASGVAALAGGVLLEPAHDHPDVARGLGPLRSRGQAIGGIDAEHALAREVDRHVRVDLARDVALAPDVGAAMKEDEHWRVLEAFGAGGIGAGPGTRAVR